jgi:hypothetical protein
MSIKILFIKDEFTVKWGYFASFLQPDELFAFLPIFLRSRPKASKRGKAPRQVGGKRIQGMGFKTEKLLPYTGGNWYNEAAQNW